MPEVNSDFKRFPFLEFREILAAITHVSLTQNGAHVPLRQTMPGPKTVRRNVEHWMETQDWIVSSLLDPAYFLPQRPH